MVLDPEIFRAYDIRGRFPDQLDAEGAGAVARAFFSWLQQNSGEGQIAVSCDGRVSSPELHRRVLADLKSVGAEVVDYGLSSTPSFYYAVAKYGHAGGVQVSASHNPKDYNGLKLVQKGAVPLGLRTGLAEIRELALASKVVSGAQNPGQVKVVEKLAEVEMNDLLSLEDFSSIGGLQVVADPGNGVAALDLDALFQKLPQVHLLRLNFAVDGNFPARSPDPFRQGNLKQLEEETLNKKADFGVALDGDGDRIFLVDETGKTVSPQVMRAFLVALELGLHPGGKVAYDVRPGRATEDVIAELGGQGLLCPVGHTNIKAVMLRSRAVFGVESSGHYFYQLPWGTFESPMLVLLKVMRYLSQSKQKLSQIVSPYQRYAHSGEISVGLGSEEAVKRTFKILSSVFPFPTQSTTDGLSVVLPDVWFNVRQSNTEPLLRFAVEGQSQERVAEVVARIREAIAQSMV